jgi:hypothetical protein
MSDLPHVRYAGKNRFTINDSEPADAFYVLEALEAAGATPAQAKAAFDKARALGGEK